MRRQVSSSRYVHLRHLHKAFHGTCSDNHLLDNTNADPEVRSKWVELAASHSVPIRCVLFTASPELCEHNDVVRALNNDVCDPLFPTNFAAHLNERYCMHRSNMACEVRCSNPCYR
jgi:predicted kinase